MGNTLADGTISLVRKEEEDAEGELFIGGIGVSSGYLHAPALTAERFVWTNFSNGQVVYRTGDLVRRRRDGNYIFVRRLDDQVKVGGFRIELPEIEAVLQQHDKVKQAVAIVRKDALYAYLMLHSSSPTLSKESMKKLLKEVKDFAARSLMYYMMPRAMMVLETFPKTPNGKLDRNSLPDILIDDNVNDDTDVNIEETKVEGEHDNALSRQPSVESIISALIAQVKGASPKPSSTFASIGVDSLGAVLFLRNLSETFGGFRISAEDVFASGVTLRSFARRLHQQLSLSRPEVLSRLNIPIDLIKEDIEGGIGAMRKNKEDDLDEGMVELLPEVASEFEAGLASNRNFLEGVRGVLTLLVLFDHYHNPVTVRLTNIFQADTALFVVMSGLTTALQLRDRPLYTRRAIKSGEKEDEIAGQALRLLPRGPFQAINFLVTRAVGIFPILWLTILLNVPHWISQTEGRYAQLYAIASGVLRRKSLAHQRRVIPTCAALHVAALQTWWRPECITSGPDTYYASILWSIFLMTVVYRTMARQLLHRILLYSGSYSGSSAMSPRSSSTSSSSSWRVICGQVAVAISYGRPANAFIYRCTAFVWFVFFLFIGVLSEVAVISWAPSVSERLYRVSNNPYHEVLYALLLFKLHLLYFVESVK